MFLHFSAELLIDIERRERKITNRSIKPSLPRNRSKSVKLQTLVPQKYFVARIKFVARSLAEKNQAWRRGFSSSIPEIRPVELASFLYYVARVTSRVKKGIAGNACAGRHKVYGGASSFAKLRRYR